MRIQGRGLASKGANKVSLQLLFVMEGEQWEGNRVL